ncbi:MAG: hypothetical protein Kow00123_14590 [Anaerolineales bacterium]
MSVFADLLTLSRVPMGLAVVYAGLNGGASALPQVIWLSLLAWTVDSVDGHLKRAARKPPNWIGRHDLTFDVFFNGCVAFFFALSGIVSAWLFSLWVGAVGLVRFILRSRSGAIAANALVVLTLVINAFQQAFALGGAIIGWAAVALALDRRRFMYRLRLFAAGIPALARRWPQLRREDE